jgi:hypothetical protein
VTTPDNGVTVQDDGTTEVILDEIAQQPVVQQPTVEELPDGGATVTMPETPVVAETPVVETPVMPEAPVVAEAPIVETPDGGATVTVPDDTYVPPQVADTYNPDTMDYVEVGDAGGDYGDSGGGYGDNNIETSYDDFGSFGGGGKFFDDALFQSSYANGGMAVPYATGGISDLGGYSDGGRLLKGPGDGVSDSIPAMIGKKQPARLADGEFVIPARIVSELGNGSTDAGARKLYQMMDRIQAARKKTTGKNRVAVNSRADKMMPV